MFCCRFFAIIILYAVAGTAVMKFVKKAEGKEVVPNISFWTQIPILIKVLYFSDSTVNPKEMFSHDVPHLMPFYFQIFLI